jgi:hypothetical protein
MTSQICTEYEDAHHVFYQTQSMGVYDVFLFHSSDLVSVREDTSTDCGQQSCDGCDDAHINWALASD